MGNEHPISSMLDTFLKLRGTLAPVYPGAVSVVGGTPSAFATVMVVDDDTAPNLTSKRLVDGHAVLSRSTLSMVT